MLSTKLQYLIVSLICLASFKAQSQYTSEINANRPSKSIGAFAVGKTVTQLESGLFYKSNPYQEQNNKQYGGEIQFRYGAFLETMELMVDIEYTQHEYKKEVPLTNFSDLSNFTLGAKYLIYDPFKNYEEKINVYSWKANNRFKWRRLIPAVSIYAGASIKTSKKFFSDDEPEISPRVVLIAQQHFNEKWALITNIMGDRLSSNEFRGYGYVVTLTHGFNNKWSAFIENQGYKNDFYTDMNARLGITTLLHKNLQLDIAGGLNYREKHESFFGQLGISWRFDKNHIPVEL